MIKILDIQQIREADQYTINNEPVSSDALMERAAGLCFEWIKENFLDIKQPIVVFAGTGNNGGDGLVIARMLHESGYFVQAYLVKFTDKLSPDCELNLKRLNKKLPVPVIESEITFPAIPENSIVIDALLGSGITRAPEGLVLNAVEKINASENSVIAIDLPSGLLADSSSQAHAGKIINADVTLTIGAPKLALFMPENGVYCGEWHLIPIGLHDDYINNAPTKFNYLQSSDIEGLFPARKTFSHKGSYGHALIMAGSKGKSGAAVLAARACLHSGCGLTTIHCPSDSVSILQTAAPEAMVSVDADPGCISTLPDIVPYSAVAFGPGCGQEKQTAGTLKLLIQESKQPLLIDADGLNILAANKTWLAFLPKNTILTPHPGEFKRLAGDYKNDFERLQNAMDFSAKFHCIMVLKGAYTSIVSPDGRVFFNSTGNPGMAKGGSGDILTGFISGLLARGIPPLHAALAGVFLHGLAGDYAAEYLTQEYLSAGDIVKYFRKAWKSLVVNRE
ncbi:Bifunctional NAD(P)H-hydrate repair enzyme Nnr [bioreactor metagenome]|uniref:Nicotinamide nucleotide repair protein n=1 Tax=bioreactor metagenome TaxID=1076179 RepID=A0A644WI71_9ZZZZ